MSVSTVGSSTAPTALLDYAAQNPYRMQYANLQVLDTQELFNVSFGTPQNAMTNVLSVLAQWAAYQKNGYTSVPAAPLIVNSLA